MALSYFFSVQGADPKHSKGKGAGEGNLHLDEEKKSWFIIQLAALGNTKAQGKPWCCLEQVETLCFPNQQSFKDISGLKSTSSPGWDVISEAGLTLSDVLQRRSMQIYTCTHLYTVPPSPMPVTAHLPARAPEILHCKADRKPLWIAVGRFMVHVWTHKCISISLYTSWGLPYFCLGAPGEMHLLLSTWATGFT